MASRFFLGAMCAGGFYSIYEDFLSNSGLAKQYFIKSSPGSGKSSFMKHIAQRLSDDGESVEYIHCSGDADSLDGVWFPGKRTAIVDATAPHALEPECHGAVGEYVHLGAFVDGCALSGRADEITDAALRCKKSYSGAAAALKAAAALSVEIEQLTWLPETVARVKKRARGVALREIERGAGKQLRKRFLSAHSPRGETVFWDTVSGMCDRVYGLESAYGLSHLYLEEILARAEALEQTAYVCYSPLNPSSRLEHILLPGQRLGFITLRPGLAAFPEPEKIRRAKLDAYADVPGGRLRFLLKIKQSLMEDVAAALSEAKSAHDKLEEFYNPHVDFTGVQHLARALSERLMEIEMC